MLKSLKLHTQLILVLFVTLSIALISIFEISNNNLRNFNERLSEDFENEVHHAIETLLLNNNERLGNLVISHAYWTDFLEKTESGDREWIQSNATKYLLDDPTYKVDNLYLINTLNGYEERYGTLPVSVYEALFKQSVLPQLAKEYSGFLVNYNGQLHILTLAALTDTDHNNISGYYVLGQRIDTYIHSDLRNLFTDKADVQLQVLSSEPLLLTKLTASTMDEILEQNFKLTIDNNRTIQLITDNANHLLNAIIGIVILSGLILVLTLLRISTNMNRSIESIRQITYHDYTQKLNLDFSKEFQDLSLCINNLSSELEKRDYDIQRKYIEIITTLIAALEAVDIYTKGHSERVSHYSVELAKAIGYEDVESIRLSGLLHDIGKISVDTKILNKPSTLTAQEFSEIQKHPMTAFNILDVSEIFSKVKDIVKSHHEKMDGTGYPEKLLGEEIPLGARIVAIADVFDSLTSKRAYRDPMPLDEALTIIKQDAGTHFDQHLVDAFLPIARNMYNSWSELVTSPDVEELLTIELKTHR